MAKRTIIAAALVVFATPAAAQMQCGSRDAVIAALSDRFGETRRMAGVTAAGQLVETFASADTGSWTVAVTYADGRMCLISTGQAYEAIQPVEIIPGVAL